MSEWNQKYYNEIKRLDYLFQKLYPMWFNIGEIDFTKKRPYYLDRLSDAADELIEALSDFALAVGEINADKKRLIYEDDTKRIYQKIIPLFLSHDTGVKIIVEDKTSGGSKDE